MSEAMRVFVASSSEQIEVAKSAAAALQSPQLEAKVWDEETFDFSDSYMESLETELERADFAVVVFTADDPANVRNKKVNLPRDNVIFELGLFTGRLGRKRCFFVIDAMSGTEVASDLSGINYVRFYRDGALTDSSRPSLDEQMKKLRKQMLDQDVRYKPSPDVRRDQAALWQFCTRLAGHWWERMRTGEDDKSAISYVTITVDEVTNTPQLHGWSYGLEGEPLADWKTVVTGTILGKEAEIHYRWKGEQEQQHAQIYGGGGHIVFDDDTLSTASGFFYDTNFAQISDGVHTRVKHFGLYRCDRADEEIMKKRWSREAKQLIRSRIASLSGR
ncbi:MAG: nucleotide-binding protein [Desulfobacterales bacterium]